MIELRFEACDDEALLFQRDKRNRKASQIGKRKIRDGGPYACAGKQSLASFSLEEGCNVERVDLLRIELDDVEIPVGENPLPLRNRCYGYFVGCAILRKEEITGLDAVFLKLSVNRV